MPIAFRRPPTLLGRKNPGDPMATGASVGAPATASSPPTAPTMPLDQAIADYQKKNPYTSESFAGLFTHLQSQGYSVARATHGNGTLPSDDALVDSTGAVYDLSSDSSGARAWTLNKLGGSGYEANRNVIGADGKFVPFSAWSTSLGSTPTSPSGSTPSAPAATVLGASRPGVGGAGYQRGMRARQAAGVTTPAGPGALPTSTSDPYAAAYAAASRRRNAGRGMGRQGTILGGFGGGTPTTQRSVLGGR